MNLTNARRWVRDFVRQRSSIGNVAPLSLGLCLVLLSAPIGDWNDYLGYLVVGGGPTGKYGYPWGLERAPGWLVLVLGWVCLAFGLRTTETPTSSTADPTAQSRSRWQRFATAVLATLGAYVALASHYVAPLQLTIDVINAPPSTELHVGAAIFRDAWNSSHYRSALDYLFGFTSPTDEPVPISRETHTEYRFAAGWISLENWQPSLYRVFVGIKDARRRKAAFVSVRSDASFPQLEILVNRRSLQPCDSHPEPSEGNCLYQLAPLTTRQRNVHVIFDLAQVELTPYVGAPFFDR
ncbi:MAG: hypothetical protein ABI895_17340 [Deltaproteobacteria bacterium]